MSKAKKGKPLSLPSENPKLKIKGSSRNDTFNIEGGIHAGRDVIMGDQSNIVINDSISKLNTPDEFSEALNSLVKEIEGLNESSDFSVEQKQKVEELLITIKDVIEEVNLSKPKNSVITKGLVSFMELADSLSGDITPMVAIGALAKTLRLISIKIFGET